MPAGNLNSRLKERYRREIVPKMREIFGYKNDLAVPRLLMVKINAGISAKFGKEDKYMETVAKTLERISGQKPVLMKARKSISAFKIRQGMTVAAMVTLRGNRMYDFVDKLINITLARVRDFQGISVKSLGNSRSLTLGFKEHVVFPEIQSDEVEKIHGLAVSIATNAKTGKEALTLLKLFGFPFQEDESK
ncbi:MAG: 50S ribosomal protein L5 [Patescibacteria group bacterium]